MYSTENNNSAKNDFHAGSDREPNLFNNSISYDHIREKSKKFTGDDHPDYSAGKSNKEESNDNGKNVMEEIMKNLDNLKSSETDMMFEYMRNPDKTVPEDKLQLFEKQHTNNNYQQTDDRNKTDTDNRHHTESLNDYMQKTQPVQQPVNNTGYNTSYVPKASSYGPSYGDGPSNISNQVDDRYHGFGSEEELNLAKLEMLRKLGELTQYGVKLSQNYNMNSDYKAMKYEYELHRSIRDKHNGTKWLSNLMLNVCWGVELANENFNPFEFKLKGWSEQMNEDIDEYYDVLGELYEKYFKSGKPIPPELKLVLMIGGSAVKFHIAHTALGKIPSLSEALMQNPALANKLKEQAVTDKVKEQFDKQKETFEKKSNEQHLMATKKAQDLQMLKEKQDEFIRMQHAQQSNQVNQQANQQYMQQQMIQQQMMQQQMMQQQLMQQQLLDKQKQLEELRKQLDQQRSDSRSMYTSGTNNSKQQATMKVPVIPESLRGKFNLASNKPAIPMSTDQFQESLRQQQILMHKQQLKDNEINKMDVGRIINGSRDSASIDPNIDNIINGGFNDTQSRISDDDRSRDSRKSTGSRKSRKKPSIKIDTK
ncbi:hypothetical protein QKU48_gp0487 [Fadolivirus algeromassiliense]|jgi:hypothetical protein|uniref:Uncharacterized protein n=1 Tax=Fadolivirus FV1/VV64 TaxID=3070911 RepID=A0A7D3QU85_9VIRU|nr:hypothetical protein QKU48_gp0487 [Fadolivirus algeromassiliense]QKF93945.1 hypothetical protein Fadolivirus_1_487 [Fadolivirus FV1/VV64]